MTRWLALAGAYAWLGLAVWTLAGAPELARAGCVGCWLTVGLWLWDGRARDLPTSVLLGAPALCCAPLAMRRRP